MLCRLTWAIFNLGRGSPANAVVGMHGSSCIG